MREPPTVNNTPLLQLIAKRLEAKGVKAPRVLSAEFRLSLDQTRVSQGMLTATVLQDTFAQFSDLGPGLRVTGVSARAYQLGPVEVTYDVAIENYQRFYGTLVPVAVIQDLEQALVTGLDNLERL